MLDVIAESGAPPLTAMTPEEAREGSAFFIEMIGAGPDVAASATSRFPALHGAIPARVYKPVPDLSARSSTTTVGAGCSAASTTSTRSATHSPSRRVRAWSASITGWRPSTASPRRPTTRSPRSSRIAERHPGEPIVVAGDSAGGNLATVAALRAREEGGPEIALQVLVYPVVDCDPTRPSYLECTGTSLILNTAEMAWFWDYYVPDGAERDHPYASPLRASEPRRAAARVCRHRRARSAARRGPRLRGGAGVGRRPVAVARYDDQIHGSSCSSTSSRPLIARSPRRALRSATRWPQGVRLAPMVTLREHLAQPGAFVIAAEVVTSRGLLTADGGAELLALARELAEDPRIDVLSITDNPGGHAMFSPDALGTDMISRGQEVIIHLACKDWNRNALESRGWQLSSAGFHNVLALSGDYPVMGHRGLAAPVFDIDSVGLLSLFSDMNAGLHDERRPGRRLDRTDFFLGCVVTNHKRHEREVMPQYFKLRKKAQAGARFVINQIGWDTRKDDELLRYIRREELDLFAVANVYLLSRGARARLSRGEDPGRRRQRRAAPARRTARREPGQGPCVLRRSRRQAPRGRARARLQRRLPRRAHAGGDLRRDPRPGRHVRSRRLARARA